MSSRVTIARRSKRALEALRTMLVAGESSRLAAIAAPELGAGGPPVPPTSSNASNRRTDARHGGGQGGAKPPSQVHTQGKCSATSDDNKAFPGSQNPACLSIAAPKRKQWSPRHTHGRGVRRSWRQWVCAVARELVTRGASREAQLLSECGMRATVRSCTDCHETIASATVTTSCDLRVCPFCARSRGAERRALLTAALMRVPGYVAARAAATVDELAALVAEHTRVRDGWIERASRARARFEHGGSAVRASAARSIERASRLADSAELARAARRFDLERAREAQRGSWGWKLVTISPKWSPQDARAYTQAGLEERARDAWERWELVRDRYSAGGLAASVASIECSEAGHVHVHALMYGPWIEHTHACEVAGCHVDVRAIEGASRSSAKRWALTFEQSKHLTKEERVARAFEHSAEHALKRAIGEAVKYIAKTPTPLRDGWIAGASGRVMHPALAASWLLAMRGAKASRVYGPARDAIACEREQRAARTSTESERVEHCRSCGSLALSEPVIEHTPAIARVLGRDWARVLSIARKQRQSAQNSTSTNPAVIKPASTVKA